MAGTSDIEWTDATWNPVRGCTRVSEGCRGCYAEGIAARFSDPGASFHGYARRTAAGSRWTGKVALVPEALAAPLIWRKPRRVFVNSMSDLFHESLPDEAIQAVFAVMSFAPHHTFQVLTKRADRMRDWMARTTLAACQAELIVRHAAAVPDALLRRARHDTINGPWPLPHVWMGVSAEDQLAAEARIPQLLRTPAAVRFVSAEPLLGPIQLRALRAPESLFHLDALTGCHHAAAVHKREPGGDLRVGLAELPRLPQATESLDWVIAGGESGPGARPAHPDWFRQLRDDCAALGTAFFFKQWGAWRQGLSGRLVLPDPAAPCPASMTDGEAAGGVWMRRVTKTAAGATLDGRQHSEYPR